MFDVKEDQRFDNTEKLLFNILEELRELKTQLNPIVKEEIKCIPTVKKDIKYQKR